MESLNLQTFTGVIFDLDGTLVESSLDFPFLRQSLNCPDDMDLLTHVAGLDVQAKAHANAFIEQHELDDARHAKWLPGALELVTTIVNKTPFKAEEIIEEVFYDEKSKPRVSYGDSTTFIRPQSVFAGYFKEIDLSEEDRIFLEKFKPFVGAQNLK